MLGEREQFTPIGAEKRELPVHPGNFEILSPKEFIIEFSSRAKFAKTRALAQTMYIEPGLALDTMCEGLLNANINKAEAAFTTDHYSFMVDEQQIAYIPSPRRRDRLSRKKQMQEKKEMLKHLETEGVSVTVTNPPKTTEKVLPFKGRNHVKVAVVDNIGWVGGVSYRDGDMEKEDFMMRFTDPKIVDILADVFHMVNEKNPTQDVVIACDEYTKVILDNGTPGKSKIFDYAIGLVKKAKKSVRFATQYAPNGAMVNAMSEQNNDDKDVSAVVSANESIVEWYGRVIDKINSASTRLKRKTFPLHLSKRRVHAKALLVDEDIPEEAEGMVGSHNLTRNGVLLGTQELAVFSSHPHFITNLKEYFDRIETAIATQDKEVTLYEH